MDNQTRALRIIFAGTPHFALPSLEVLIESEHEVLAVLTQPDRPAGRGKQLRASPVKQLALKHGLNVLQPKTLKSPDWQQKLMDLKADLMVVVAYGLMIPGVLLEMPKLGCWNIHASLLPRWRGAAPIHRAVEAGDTQTGVCIMQMEVTLDTGPVYQCLTIPIGPEEDTGQLHDVLARMGAKALMQCISLAVEGKLPAPVVQDQGKATYAHKLSKAEAQLNWNEPAELLARKVCAFNPWPVAWCELGGQRLRIFKAEALKKTIGCLPGDMMVEQQSLVISTINGSLKILELQRAGGQRMTAKQFLNANGKALLGLSNQASR